MYKFTSVSIFAAVFAFAAFPGYADGTDGRHINIAQETTSQVHQGRGTVNKVDVDAGKINISHEAISSLKWPSMTMDFNVQDKSALAGVKPGMTVDFEIVKIVGGYRITRIVPVK
jgi:Cu(I)/Ag(I) efflux system periplasmic protein CusF